MQNSSLKLKLSRGLKNCKYQASLDKSRLLASITLTKAYRQLNLICKTKTWGIFEGAVE